jgi:hypothetical protein
MRIIWKGVYGFYRWSFKGTWYLLKKHGDVISVVSFWR